MSVTVKITDTDMGYKALQRRLRGFAKLALEGGLFDEEQVEKGIWAEFGTDRRTPAGELVKIKPRPWLSVAGDQGVGEMASMMEASVGELCDGSTPRGALRSARKRFKAMIRRVLTEQRVGGPELAPSTIRRKGSRLKLIDTSKMLKAIDAKVSKAEGQEGGGS